MFRGRHNATMDDKGRLKIPTQFREKLFTAYGHNVFITCLSSKGEYVRIYPLAEWEKIEKTISQIPFVEPARQPLEDAVNYYGMEGSVDRQGRVLIPQVLRESAQIERNKVLVLGKTTFIEIWKAELFEKRLSQMSTTNESLHTLTQYRVWGKEEDKK